MDIVTSVGFIHNETLDYLTQNPDFSNLIDEKLFILVSDFVVNKFRNLGFYYRGIDYDSVEKYLKEYRKEPRKFIDFLELNGYVNSYTKEIINKILTLSSDIDNPQYVYTEIKGLINYLSKNIKITDKERICLIGTAYIAIYSNSYWSFQNSNPHSPWSERAAPGWIERDAVAFMAGCWTCFLLDIRCILSRLWCS